MISYPRYHDYLVAVVFLLGTGVLVWSRLRELFKKKPVYRSTSRSFCAHGTKVFVNGRGIAEVRDVHIGRHVIVQANWIPESYGHDYLLNVIRKDLPAYVEIHLPAKRGILEFRCVSISGYATLRPNDVATLDFSFEATTNVTK